MPVPEKTEEPVSRDTIDLRPSKHHRACCRESMQCPCPKRPKDLLAGTQTNCGPANTAWFVVGEACDARARKDRRAGNRDTNDLRPRKRHISCCRGSMRCPFPKRPKGLLAGTQSTCGLANTTGPVVGEACDARARKDRRAGLQGRKVIAAPQTPQSLL